MLGAREVARDPEPFLPKHDEAVFEAMTVLFSNCLCFVNLQNGFIVFKSTSTDNSNMIDTIFSKTY